MYIHNLVYFFKKRVSAHILNILCNTFKGKENTYTVLYIVRAIYKAMNRTTKINETGQN